MGQPVAITAKPLAHTPNPQGLWHLLEDHLRATATMAAEFAGHFGAAELGGIVGWAHDIGKCSCTFSSYLQACHTLGDEAAKKSFPKRDHKRAGAVLVKEAGKHGTFLAAAVLGHHGGMADIGDVRAKLAGAEADPEIQEVLSAAKRQIDAPVFGHLNPALPAWVREGPADRSRAGQEAFARDVEMLYRFVFSALVDADFLDTEAHFKPGRPAERSGMPSLSDLAARFAQRRAELVANSTRTPVNEARSAMYAKALESAGCPPGIYQLATPTGSGKTIIGLGWALAHAVANGLRSVITALPFITVTEQVAGVYRDMLDEPDQHSVVLEHHSQVDAESGWQKLAAENWASPVVVTTTVRLFESLFSNRTSACRKLHRLAGSVIVVDEAQALPIEVLDPVADALRCLVERFGASVLIMTATQPTLECLPAMSGRRPAEDLLAGADRWGPVFLRTRVSQAGRLTHADVAGRVRASGRCLCVLNTIKDARRIAQDAGDGVVYLSTHLRPADRWQRIKAVRASLQRGEECRVVSTQLVEAGVDFDFPLVLRALAPLPSLAQADGRCNRNGLMPGLGETVVFDLIDGGYPPGPYYQTGTALTRAVLARGEVDVRARSTVAEWYRLLLKDPTSSLDRRDVQPKRTGFLYESVEKAFRMIDQDTVAVAVPWPSEDPRASRIEEILAFLGSRPTVSFAPLGPRDVRALQEVTVQLRRRLLDRAVEEGCATQVNDTLFRWEGGYDSVTGLVFAPTAQEDLIW